MAGRMQQQDAQCRARSAKKAPGRSKDDEDSDWTLEEYDWDARNLVASRKCGSGPQSIAQEKEPCKGRSRISTVCQVESCEADLSGLKEYHQRYKICEQHLMMASLVVKGRRQRFCQQCGRFHDLGAFDGEKKSCRERLQKHNARRRKKNKPSAQHKAVLPKPRADTTASKRQKQAPSRQEGMDCEPEAEQAPVRKGLATVAVLPSHAEAVNASLHLDVRLSNYGRSDSRDSDVTMFDGDQFAALQEILETFQDDRGGAGSPLPTCGNKAFSNFLPSTDELLAGTPISMPPQGSLPIYDGIPTLREANPFAYERQQDAPAACPSQQEDKSSAAAGELSLPRGGGRLFYNTAEPGRNPDTQSLTPAGLGPLGIFATHSLPSPREASAPTLQRARSQGAPLMHLGEPCFSLVGASPAPSAALEDARRLMAPHSAPAVDQYQVDNYLFRMSMKLFNCKPEDLNVHLKNSLLDVLGSNNGVEGSIRSGCVLLTVDAHVDSDNLARLQAMDPVQAIALVLGSSGAWASQPGSRAIVQWGTQVVNFRNGKCKLSTPTTATRAMPQVISVSPLAVLNTEPGLLQVSGRNLGKRGDEILVRSQGSYLSTSQAGTSSSSTSVSLQLSPVDSSCVAQVEVLHEGTLSAAQPFLVLSSAAAVAEIQQLASEDLEIRDGFLMDMGRVLNLQTGAEAVSEAEKLQVGNIARRLVLIALRRGWPAVTQMLLPSARLGCADVADAVKRMEDALDPTLTLLHLAVASGSLHLVRVLLEWTTAGGCELYASAAGPGGLAPAHLASLHSDGGAMADLLTDLCTDVLLMWHFPRFQGFSPAQFAAANGNAKFLERGNARGPSVADGADAFGWIFDSQVSDRDSDDDSAFDDSDGERAEELTCADLSIREPMLWERPVQPAPVRDTSPSEPAANARELLDTPMSFYATEQEAVNACEPCLAKDKLTEGSPSFLRAVLNTCKALTPKAAPGNPASEHQPCALGTTG